MLLAVHPRRTGLHIVARRSSAGAMGATPVANVYHAAISVPLAVEPPRAALGIEGWSPSAGDVAATLHSRGMRGK